MPESTRSMPWSLTRLLCARHRRQDRAVSVIVSLALALAGAASFTAAAAGGTMAEDIARRVVSPEPVGFALALEASRRASTPFLGVSALVLCIFAAAISCVLTVAFLGQKRSLGIMKVLGATVPDLRRLFALEALRAGAAGIPAGMLLGLLVTGRVYGYESATFSCFLVSASSGLAALALGVYLPLRLIRNGSCDQLLNNRPVYAATNPSCAKCGLCGGF